MVVVSELGIMEWQERVGGKSILCYDELIMRWVLSGDAGV